VSAMLVSVPSATRPRISKDELSALSRDVLGQDVVDLLFESGYSSAVFGVRLMDGDRVVVKVRPWNDRLVACTTVQLHLAAVGFPCPRPLLGPVKREGLGVSVEQFVPGGEQLPRHQAARPLAELLGDLIRQSPPASDVGPLEPEYGFLRWRDAGHRLWPAATDTTVDLNDRGIGAPWIDEIAYRVLSRLAEVDLPSVIGHGDWWSENVRWEDGAVISVDDWDSAVALPEAAIVGAAAALFADGESSVDETADFINSYSFASRNLSSSDEKEIAWATGLWARLFDAKKALALGYPLSAQRLRKEAADRSRFAGLPAHG
jgi:hypothetical protein